jgi:hypothetical protein
MRGLVLLLLALILPVHVYAGVMSPAYSAEPAIQSIVPHTSLDAHALFAEPDNTSQLPDIADDVPQLALQGDIEETPLPAMFHTSRMTRTAFLRQSIVSPVVDALTMSVFRPPRFA